MQEWIGTLVWVLGGCGMVKIHFWSNPRWTALKWKMVKSQWLGRWMSDFAEIWLAGAL